MSDRYISETYRGHRIALLWDKGAYSAYLQDELIPGWKVQNADKGIELLRDRVDELLRFNAPILGGN